jgi:phage repressor protein C with HTH and peptisase S24 domain
MILVPQSTTMFVGQSHNKFCNFPRMGTLAARLKEAMEDAGLSQERLAKAASTKNQKVTQQTVQQLLRPGGLQSSKHLPSLAKALGVSLDWLTSGEGEKKPAWRPQALVVGKVGAGADITRFDDGVVLESIDAPPGIGECVAARVEGDSMFPQLENGWLVFYGREHDGIPEECIGRLSVVQIKDGPTLLKRLKRGSRRGMWTLESWNAPPREDVKLLWASKVLYIKPF